MFHLSFYNEVITSFNASTIDLISHYHSSKRSLCSNVMNYYSTVFLLTSAEYCTSSMLHGEWAEIWIKKTSIFISSSLQETYVMDRSYPISFLCLFVKSMISYPKMIIITFLVDYTQLRHKLMLKICVREFSEELSLLRLKRIPLFWKWYPLTCYSPTLPPHLHPHPLWEWFLISYWNPTPFGQCWLKLHNIFCLKGWKPINSLNYWSALKGDITKVIHRVEINGSTGEWIFLGGFC